MRYRASSEPARCPRDTDAPGGRGDGAGDAAQKCRLARAVRTEDRDPLPRRGPEVDVRQDHVVAEAVVERVDLEDGLHGRGDRGWHPIIAVGKTPRGFARQTAAFDVTDAAPGRR